ncbi:MAG: cadherin domain-containing protein [Acidobacteria bacterium]|nr:cadherin domain-containing protein [Acidobacteriota bacterium]
MVVRTSRSPGAGGEPVSAADADASDTLTYRFVPGDGEGLFEIGGQTGQITVGGTTMLDYESGDTLHTLRVEASDGLAADTATVTIRVTDQPPPGKPDAPVVRGSETGLVAEWRDLENTVPPVTGWGVRWGEKDEDPELWTYLPNLASRTLIVANRPHRRTYQVQVRAISAEGTGPWSDPGEATTNAAPAFGAASYERSVAEDAAAGTAVGGALTAADTPGDTVAYRLVGDGGTGRFEIGGQTGQITVGGTTMLDYESGDTLHTLRVEASDGLAADTAVVTVRVTDADDPGVVVLSAPVARVGVPLAATLTDPDGVVGGSRVGWERFSGAVAQWSAIAGADAASYTPVPADRDKVLRAVFTYHDRHGPERTAVSAAVRVEGANTAPVFPAAAGYERSVAENAPAGLGVGGPVVAADADGDTLRYRFVPGGGEALFEIGGRTGQITVGDTAALDYESGDTLHTLRIEASDGLVADTATVTVRVTDADDPGTITLSTPVARVGVRITATLMDQDRSVESSKVRRWERAEPDSDTWTAVAGADTRHYTPVAGDEGRQLRAVFTYTDGHGPNKTATSAAVRVTGGNVPPVFAAATPTRRVAENSPGGTEVGVPVTATDANEDTLAYRFVPGGGGALFEIGPGTGQITVAEGAALDYEGGTRSYTVTVEASDGELADTATVTIRITNADDPGRVALDAGIARVGVRIAATLMDQDGSLNAGKRRRWERAEPGSDSWTAIAGATTRFYTPVAGDEGRRLRAVFTYRDRHGPNKTAVSENIGVVGATTPLAAFGAASYTVPAGGSVDIAVTVSHAPAATAGIPVSLVAGTDTTSHTVTLQAGATEATLTVSAAARATGDTITARLGTLPAGWVAAPPSETRIAVTEAGGGMAGDAASARLSVSFADASYEVAAGGPGTVVTVRLAPAADRALSVPLTTAGLSGALAPDGSAGIPAAVAFEPGDSLATFIYTPAPDSPGAEIALAFGKLPDRVTPGTPATALVTVTAAGTDALFDESLEAGLAVLGRAVAEGAGQAVRGRIAAAMRDRAVGEGAAPARSARGWATLAAGEIASLSGVPTSTAALPGAAQAPATPTIRLPGAREAAGRLLPRLSFATPLGGSTSAAALPRFSVWAHGSAQQYRGRPGGSASSGGLSYDGAMQALAAGADARLGSSALAGLALMRSSGEFNYNNRSLEGALGHAMTTVHPYLMLRPSARVGLWAMGGLGSGDLDDEAGRRTLPARLRMLSGGADIPLARRGPLGLALAADAFGVSMRTGASGATPEREGAATRARALLEASWKARGLTLATRAGARYDGGDADTGAGAETGGSLAFRGRGLDLALDTRAAFGSGGHREWGASLRLAYDPGTPGQGLRIAVSPARGQTQSGLRGLIDHGQPGSSPAHGDSWRLDAETGYALPHLGNGSLDTYTRLSAQSHLRLWSAGARYDMNHSLQLTLESALNNTATQTRGLKLGLNIKF